MLQSTPVPAPYRLSRPGHIGTRTPLLTVRSAHTPSVPSKAIRARPIPQLVSLPPLFPSHPHPRPSPPHSSMLYSSAASLLLAGLAAAAPTLIPAALEARSTKVEYEYLNVTYSSSSSSGRNVSLPNVLILATGGKPGSASALTQCHC